MKLSSFRLNVERGRIDNANLKDYGETAIVENTGVGGTYTIDLTRGNVYQVTLQANTTFTFSNIAASTSAVSFTLILKQDGVGFRTATWPAAVIWPGNVAPTLTTTPLVVDIFSFLSEDGGTTWRGFQPNKNVTLPQNSLFSWGDNAIGFLGLGDAVNRSSAVQVGTLATWANIVTGQYHSLALKADGTIWSWGGASIVNAGQLGVGDTLSRSSPVQIGTLATWVKIAAGRYHSLALKTDGSLWVWGSNGTGQSGLGDTNSRSSPVQVGTLANWTSIVGAVSQSLVIKSDGSLWSWGSGSNGSLGLNDVVARSSPVQVGTLANWAKVATGKAQILTIKTDGTLWSWGQNTSGQIGVGDAANRSSPTQVGTLTTWASAGGGALHAFGVKTDGSLWSWGLNSSGQLGLNDVVARSSPVQVGTLGTWIGAAGGDSNSLVLDNGGKLWTWGLNNTGQLGQGDTVNRSSPTQVGTLTTWANSVGGVSHTISIRSS
jgi:alpha-tubulin suppressor-like RCC1 family protein